jgi:hypothetical protein
MVFGLIDSEGYGVSPALTGYGRRMTDDSIDFTVDWLTNLNQTLASEYARDMAVWRLKVELNSEPTEPHIRAFIQGYMKACDDFAVSADQKEAVLRRAGLTD